jgi:DNA repair ATPase RecN
MTVLPLRSGAVSVAVLTAAMLGLALAIGLDVMNISYSFDQSRQAAARAVEIDAIHDRFLDQIAASNAVAARLAAAQTNLAEAVDDLAEINRDRSEFADTLRIAFPDAMTYRACLARYVLGKINRRFADDPTHLAEVSARLEAEYQCMNQD